MGDINIRPALTDMDIFMVAENNKITAQDMIFDKANRVLSAVIGEADKNDGGSTIRNLSRPLKTTHVMAVLTNWKS